MKVTVSFGTVRVIVPCGDGDIRVCELIEKAITRYKKATGKPSHYWVTIHDLRSSHGGGILDPDDALIDVADDREQIVANFEEQGYPPHLHNGGDGASASSVGTSSPDIFHHHDTSNTSTEIVVTPGMVTSDSDIVVTPNDLITATPLRVRRGSDPCLNLVPDDDGNKPNYAEVTSTFPSKKSKRWSTFEGITGEYATSTPKSKDRDLDGATKPLPAMGSWPLLDVKPSAFSRFSRDGSRQSLSNKPNMAKWFDAQDRNLDKMQMPEGRREPLGRPQSQSPSPTKDRDKKPLPTVPQSPGLPQNSPDAPKSSPPPNATPQSPKNKSRLGSADTTFEIRLPKGDGPLGIHVVPDIGENKSSSLMACLSCSTRRKRREQGLLVQRVEVEGRIHADGRLKADDRIVKINGTSLDNVNFQSAQNIFKQALLTDELILYVHRGGSAPPLPKVPPPTLPKPTAKSRRISAHMRSVSDTQNISDDSSFYSRHGSINQSSHGSISHSRNASMDQSTDHSRQQSLDQTNVTSLAENTNSFNLDLLNTSVKQTSTNLPFPNASAKHVTISREVSLTETRFDDKSLPELPGSPRKIHGVKRAPPVIPRRSASTTLSNVESETQNHDYLQTDIDNCSSESSVFDSSINVSKTRLKADNAWIKNAAAVDNNNTKSQKSLNSDNSPTTTISQTNSKVLTETSSNKSHSFKSSNITQNLPKMPAIRQNSSSPRLKSTTSVDSNSVRISASDNSNNQPSQRKQPVTKALSNTRNIFINLTKAVTGIGFSVTTRDNPAGRNYPIYIKTVLPNGPAIQDGRLKAGDMLLEVNGTPMMGLSQAEAVNVLRAIRVGDPVNLSVSRPETHQSHQLDSHKVPRELPESDPVFQPNERGDSDQNSGKLPSKSREIHTLNIPLNESGSAGLGISVKGITVTTDKGIVDEGIFIKNVISGGAASKDGRLQVNDQLLQINDESLANLSNSESMDCLRRAMQKDGPIAGCINIKISRRTGPITDSPRIYEENDMKFGDVFKDKISRTSSVNSDEVMTHFRADSIQSTTSDVSDVGALPFRAKRGAEFDSMKKRNESYSLAVKDSFEESPEKQALKSKLSGMRNGETGQTKQSETSHPRLKSAPTVNGTTGETVMVENDQVVMREDGEIIRQGKSKRSRPHSSIGLMRTRSYSSSSNSQDNEEVVEGPPSPPEWLMDWERRQSIAKEDSVENIGFQRDGFNRRSLSEKRKGRHDARGTELYWRVKQQPKVSSIDRRSKSFHESEVKRLKWLSAFQPLMRSSSAESIFSSTGTEDIDSSFSGNMKGVGVKKSSSLESLTTDILPHKEPPQVCDGVKISSRSRAFNESFRAAVDRSYSAEPQTIKTMDTLDEESSGSGSGSLGNRGPLRSSFDDHSEDSMKRRKKKGLLALFKFGKNRKPDHPVISPVISTTTNHRDNITPRDNITQRPTIHEYPSTSHIIPPEKPSRLYANNKPASTLTSASERLSRIDQPNHRREGSYTKEQKLDEWYQAQQLKQLIDNNHVLHHHNVAAHQNSALFNRASPQLRTSGISPHAQTIDGVPDGKTAQYHSMQNLQYNIYPQQNSQYVSQNRQHSPHQTQNNVQPRKSSPHERQNSPHQSQYSPHLSQYSQNHQRQSSPYQTQNSPYPMQHSPQISQQQQNMPNNTQQMLNNQQNNPYPNPIPHTSPHYTSTDHLNNRNAASPVFHNQNFQPSNQNLPQNRNMNTDYNNQNFMNQNQNHAAQIHYTDHMNPPSITDRPSPPSNNQNAPGPYHNAPQNHGGPLQNAPQHHGAPLQNAPQNHGAPLQNAPSRFVDVSRSDRIQTLRQEHQRRHRERNGQYPQDYTDDGQDVDMGLDDVKVQRYVDQQRILPRPPRGPIPPVVEPRVPYIHDVRVLGLIPDPPPRQATKPIVGRLNSQGSAYSSGQSHYMNQADLQNQLNRHDHYLGKAVSGPPPPQRDSRANQNTRYAVSDQSHRSMVNASISNSTINNPSMVNQSMVNPNTGTNSITHQSIGNSYPQNKNDNLYNKNPNNIPQNYNTDQRLTNQNHPSSTSRQFDQSQGDKRVLKSQYRTYTPTAGMFQSQNRAIYDSTGEVFRARSKSANIIDEYDDPRFAYRQNVPYDRLKPNPAQV